ncbi:MAG: transcriptional regulator, partial [Arthrobacter sp.]
RDRNPALQVVESLARVRRLDQDHLAHLVALVCEAPGPRRRKARAEVPPPGALNLLNSMTQPAFLEGRYFDILAANPLASALSPRLSEGRNYLRDMFLDPAEQDLYPDWEFMTECSVASLRQAVGKDIDDPRFIELTGELSLASPRFVQLWARHDVKGPVGGTIRLHHPEVGELTLHRERLEVGGADGITLVVFHPEQGTDDAGKLALLASAHLPATGVSQWADSRVSRRPESYPADSQEPAV